MFFTKNQLFKLLSQAFDAGQISYAEMKEGCLEKIWAECEAGFIPQPAKEKMDMESLISQIEDVWPVSERLLKKSTHSRFKPYKNDALKTLEEVFGKFEDSL